MSIITRSARSIWSFLRASIRLPHRIALAAILLVSIFCNFWMLGQAGFDNQYYSQTVQTMGSSWRNFFFATFDTAMNTTVDKPPLGFWMQVLSTKIFGFTPFAVDAPQALAGVLAVLLLYWLVRRQFGRVAGLISAAVLAASPISVATSRDNTIDSTLILVLLAAAWAVFRAIETDRYRWLLLAGVLVAVGFNVKMLEAYLPVPAFALAYLLSSRRPWARRLVSLASSGLAMVILSLWWVLTVDFIPINLRPWVGSTQDDSELSLALGWNGLTRLFGIGHGPNGGKLSPGRGGPTINNGEQICNTVCGVPGSTPPAGSTGIGNGTPSGTPGIGGPGGPTMTIGGPGRSGFPGMGNPGPLRLFAEPLGGQIGWLLPLALVAIVALAVIRPFRPREDRRHQALLLWGTWLVTTVVFFSVAGFFHQYYLSQVAPIIAALAGIGVVTMWEQYRQPGWRGWLLPLALALTAAEQIVLIGGDPSWGIWLIPVIAGPVGLAALVLVIARLRPGVVTRAQSLLARPSWRFKHAMGVTTVVVGLSALLATPAIWSFYPAVANVSEGQIPTAGLHDQSHSGGFPTLERKPDLPPGDTFSFSLPADTYAQYRLTIRQ